MNATFLIGLALFLAVHSIRIVADGWRSAMIARLGPLPWKGLIAALSLLGFVLLVWGYGESRVVPTTLWLPPPWFRQLAALLTLPAFILVAAAYVPGNHFRAAIGHPMLVGTKFWALAHLLANGNLADVLLFGSFLVWSVILFSASRRRDRTEGRGYPAGQLARTIITLVIGTLAWGGFAVSLHQMLIGVQAFD